jgi:OOP family OmpA-OmpF porin
VLTSDEARRTRADRIALGGGVYDACTLINSQSALNGFIQEVFWTTVEPDVTDSDMDGIYDAMDECPGTPAEVANTMNGCWKGAYTVFFEFNQSDIQNMYEPYVREAARLLREHPDLMVSIEGHADAVGTESYNEGLAMERSQAVKDMLVANGVSAARLDAGEASENQPVAPNDSSAFRELNRRVELILWQPGYNE